MRTYFTHIIFLLVLLCCCAHSFSQENCEIFVDPTFSVCDTGTFTITTSGNATNVQWTNEDGLLIGTGPSLTRNIQKTEKIYLVNKIPFGPELIKNGDFEKGNVDFSSDYFNSCTQGSMPQGAYCVEENSGVFHPGWSDCIGKNGTGKMLISDGAVITNENIWCQTVAVEQNKLYAFSAWITSLISSNPPIMQFSINDELLGQAFQTNDTPCEWQEFFQKWNSTNHTSAKICIVNQSTEGEGNDFGIDEISLRESCFSFDTAQVILLDSMAIDLGADTSFCAGDEKSLQNLLQNPHKNIQYQWSNGSNDEVITITEPSQYILTISIPEGCTNSDTITLTDLGFPKNTLPDDTAVCFIAHQTATLRADSALFYEWHHEGQVKYNRYLNTPTAGSFLLILSNGEHCTSRHEITITDECSYNLFIPSAFSPNNDGLNDFFGPVSLETYEYEFIIYDKGGQKIYEGKSIDEPWDGKKNGHVLPAGVYVYHLKYSVIDMYSERIKPYVKTGIFTLIR